MTAGGPAAAAVAGAPGVDDVQLIITLTDEEIVELVGRVDVDLPLPSLDHAGDSSTEGATRATQRSLVARGLADAAGRPTDDVKELIDTLREPVVQGERVLADRTDHVRLAAAADDVVADLITADGFHQFLTGTPEGLTDLLVGWAVPVKSSYEEMPDVRVSRQRLAEEADVLQQLGEIEVVTSLRLKSIAEQEFSIFAGAAHVIRATTVEDDVTFAAMNEPELRSMVTALLERALS